MILVNSKNSIKSWSLGVLHYEIWFLPFEGEQIELLKIPWFNFLSVSAKMGTEDNGEMGLLPLIQCGSDWDPLVSMDQSLHYPVLVDNQPLNRTSHLVPYPSNSNLVDMLPKITAFENEGFSEMISSYGVSNFHPNYIHNNVVATQEDCWNLEEVGVRVLPNGKRKSSESHSASNTAKV